MAAAFSFGPLGAMGDLKVAPAVPVGNAREVRETVTSRGVRWVQRARRNPRSWPFFRPWQDPRFVKALSLAAAGLGGDMYLYDRACARQNMLPSRLAAGAGPVLPVGYAGTVARTNLLTNPTFENGLSPSNQSVLGNGGSSTSIVDAVWSGSGAHSLRNMGNGTNNASVAYPVGTLSSTMLVPGRTYTFSATMHLEDAQVGVPYLRSRRIGIGIYGATGAITYGYALSPEAPNTAHTTTRLVVTAKIPEEAQRGFLLLCNGSVGTPVWWDQLTLEEGATDGSYFDGGTLPGGDATYRWTGTPHDSVSQQILGAEDHVYLGAVTWQSVSVPLLGGRTYTISGWTRSPESPLSASWPGQAATEPLPAPVGGATTLTITPAADGFLVLTRLQEVSGVRVHEGIPDGRFYATEGTPCLVAVSDPERTYQLVTDTETRTDYSVTLYEVGNTGIY